MPRSTVRYLDDGLRLLDELVTEGAGPGDDELELGPGPGGELSGCHEGIEAFLLLKAAEGGDQHRVLAQPRPLAELPELRWAGLREGGRGAGPVAPQDDRLRERVGEQRSADRLRAAGFVKRCAV